MSWIYFPDSADSETPSSQPSEQAGASEPTASSTRSAKVYSSPEWPGEKSIGLPSGTTSGRSGPATCPGSTPSAEDGPARETPTLALERAWTTSGRLWSSRSLGLFANFDPESCSWKTSQGSLLLLETESDSSSMNWPDSVMTAGTRCFQQRRLVPLIDASDSGSWPTPTQMDTFAFGKKDVGRTSENSGMTLLGRAAAWPTPMSRDWKSGDASQDTLEKNARPLNEIAQNWPTPTVADDRTGNFKSSQQKPGSMHSVTLPQLAQRMATGGGGMISQPGHPDQTNSKPGEKSSSTTPKLNPLFVEWLLGYPIGTTVLEPWVIQWIESVRKSRRKSSSTARLKK